MLNPLTWIIRIPPSTGLHVVIFGNCSANIFKEYENITLEIKKIEIDESLFGRKVNTIGVSQQALEFGYSGW